MLSKIRGVTKRLSLSYKGYNSGVDIPLSNLKHGDKWVTLTTKT